jgi:hypothetical protein
MQLAFSDPLALALVALGLATAVGAVVLVALRAARLGATAGRLAYAALDGRPEEARVEARQGGRRLAPLLDALGSDPTPPRTRPWGIEVAVVVALFGPVMLLVLYGWGSLHTAEPATRPAAAAALFLGLAVLLPAALSAAALVVLLGRRSARALRGTCVTLIAKGVRAAVDAEVADALRRGQGPRDPRGE